MDYGSDKMSHYSGNSYISQQDVHSTYSKNSVVSFHTNANPSILKCDYCANTHRAHLVKCVSENCNRFFCNNRFVANTRTSHIISHLKNANHNFIEIDSRIKGARHSPKCDICQTRNIFSLGFFGKGKNLICRVPCLLKKKDKDHANFQALVNEERLIDRLFLMKNKFKQKNGAQNGRIFNSRHSQVTLQEIREIELELAGIDLNELPLKDHSLRICRRYQSKEHYIQVFKHLITLESSEEALRDQRSCYREIQLYFDDDNPEIKRLISNQLIKTKAMFYGHEIGCKFTDKDEIQVTSPGGWDSSARLIRKDFGKFIIETTAPIPNFVSKVSMHSESDTSVCTRLTESLKIFSKTSIDPVIENVVLGRDVDCSTKFNLPIIDYTINGKFELNQSQIRAIKNSLQNRVSIIHGPPGTGKTKTIVTLIYHIKKLCNSNSNEQENLLIFLKYLKKKVEKLEKKQDSLSRNKIEYYKKKVDIYEKVYFEKFKEKSEVSDYFTKKSRILVCAPSNYPVFDLREKIEKAGLKTIQVLAKSKEEEFKNTPGTLRFLTDKELNSSQQYQDLMDQISNEQKKNSPDVKEIERLQGLIRKTIYEKQKEIVKRYDIICCTCITSSNLIFLNDNFDFVIVDEATQALEPEIIICLLKKAKHLVLVGDKLQLGSMVVSKSAKDLGLDVSMIERFEDLTIPYTLLSSQYRMDPRIAEFSNSRFYERKIESFHKIREFPGFNFPTIVNSPLFFYHVGSSEEYAGSGASFVNRYEADVIVSLIQYMKDKKVPPEEIGVITFYDGQKGFLIQYLETHLDFNYANGVDVMSVDASQGREKGFIILSCVRSNSKIGVGFLSEFRRLNVAMTRAKYGLVVCGNAGTLLTDPLWTDLIKFFDDQGLVFSGPLSTLKKEKLMIGHVLKFNPKRPNKYADND